MTTMATYIYLPGTTEEAFEFYRSAFGTEFVGPGIMRMGEAPPEPGQPELSEEEKQHVMHVGLPTVGDHMLMGTDVIDAEMGNAMSIMIVPDTRAEADDLFAKLSEGGTVTQPMADMFWGDYYGAFTDRFGVSWMVDVDGSAE